LRKPGASQQDAKQGTIEMNTTRPSSTDSTTGSLGSSGGYYSPACSLHEFSDSGTPLNQPDIRTKRIYAAPEASDGYRVLVARFWPRPVKRRDAALDDWLKDLAPSATLHKWFANDPRRGPEFCIRYRAELTQQQPLVNSLRQRATQQRVTLLYGAADPQFNPAVVLEEALRAFVADLPRDLPPV
jgi:uncharacterized protein YeaO (DUF488 family)